ncbi:MAG TPA: hypothetical protein VL863_08940 [bacterium]|jgi:hypothetical protein|nr:hypothetical protein [bacterium]
MKTTFLNRFLRIAFTGAILMLCGGSFCQGALSLSGTSYVQDFNGIGSGLPTGWTVNTGATAFSLGASGVTFYQTPGDNATWGSGTGGFKNIASASIGGGVSTTTQNAATDRVLGIRQTTSFGDPGAAFVLEIVNTTGLNNFSLSLDMQMLSVQQASTTWIVQYGLGNTPTSFTTLGTYSDPSTFGSTTVAYDSTSLSGINNQSQEVWFRVVALNTSTGGGTRDTFGIDNFNLTYSSIPEPAAWGAASAVGLLAISGFTTWRERKPKAAISAPGAT